MTPKEYIDFANALKNNYTIDFDKLPEFCDMAILILFDKNQLVKDIADFVGGYTCTNSLELADEILRKWGIVNDCT